MRNLVIFAAILIGATAPALAQEYQQELQQAQTETQPQSQQPIEQVMPVPTTPAPVQNNTATPPPQYEAQKFAILQTLDKITARTATVTLPINTPSAVGPLFIEVKSCQKTPPNEQPQSAGFLQIWEAKPKSATMDSETKPQSQWVFSGWMFASSPALSAMNHPIYDVWLKDCVNEIPSSKVK
jgi:hypothetical protein